jgi:FkbM family methyltransferase
MLIPLPEIIKKYNLNIRGVLQIGAHWAEEHQVYLDLGIKNIIYIEPCQEAFSIMINKLLVNESDNGRKYFNYTTVFDEKFDKYLSISFINYACGDKEGEIEMNVSHNNQGQSNSLLKPNLHLLQHPEVVFNDSEKVEVKTLDWLMNNYIFSITPIEKRNEKYNLLVMDVQGAEGLVLKGATETLKHVDIIYTEVNRDYTYENNMLIGEMDDYLSNFGFARVKTYWPSSNWSWGDAIYLRESLLQ